MSDKKLLSIKDAAKLLDVTPLTLRNWDNAGKLKALRHPMNNYRVYRLEDIEKLLQELDTIPKPYVRRNKKTPKKLSVRHLE